MGNVLVIEEDDCLSNPAIAGIVLTLATSLAFIWVNGRDQEGVCVGGVPLSVDMG
jgi:hypothetical protein